MLAGLMLFFGGWMLIEPFCIQTVRTTLSDPDVPETGGGLKIVFVSDIHHGPSLSLGRVDSLVRRINAESPDLVLLGGDYIHYSGDYIPAVFQALSGLKAPLGVYGAMGNHDNWDGRAETLAAARKNGITLLDNKAVDIPVGDGHIRLGGVGDYNTGRQRLQPTLEGTSADDFILLLSHNPDYVMDLPDDTIDLLLCGHTHGGQVTLFGLWAPFVPSDYGDRFVSGLYEVNGNRMLVSNGIGTVNAPIRFFARPQMNVITLVKGQ